MDTFYSNDEQSNNKNNNNGEYHLKNFLYFLLGFFYGLTDEIDMQMNENNNKWKQQQLKLFTFNLD